MPFVEISLAEGRSPEQIRRLLRDVHNAVAQALGSPEGNIRVVAREVPKTHWSAGGRTLAERDHVARTAPVTPSTAPPQHG